MNSIQYVIMRLGISELEISVEEYIHPLIFQECCKISAWVGNIHWLCSMVWIVLELRVELAQLVGVDQGMIKFHHIQGRMKY